MSEPDEGRLPGPQKWPLEDDLPFLYANYFTLLDTSNEIILAFGNFLPIGIHGRSQTEVMGYLEEAEVNPVAKIVMSQKGLTALYNLLKGRMDQEGGRVETNE